MATTTMKMTEATVRDAAPGEYCDKKVPAFRLSVGDKGRSFGARL
ncbi:hypothetical protein QTI24_13155 [Variovorax sp. J22P240]|nr:hypothetical protein [Variovorax sp. J22P240]MDL9999560.1 hypothetical protein [Variovorax sp. J22P240]